MRNYDIEWASECYISSPKTKIRFFKHPKEIETLLHKYEKVFRDLAHGRTPNRGVEHNIVLKEGTSPIHIPPYRHPKKFIDDIENSFQKMKEVMSSCPILALPGFSKPFAVECDASCEGIGDVLKQGQHPIAFERIKLQHHEKL